MGRQPYIVLWWENALSPLHSKQKTENNVIVNEYNPFWHRKPGKRKAMDSANRMPFLNILLVYIWKGFCSLLSEFQLHFNGWKADVCLAQKPLVSALDCDTRLFKNLYL